MAETPIKHAQLPAPPKPIEEMTAKEKAEYSEQLTAALDSLRPVKKDRVGQIVGEGIAAERVLPDVAWFLDLPERQKEDPNYKLHEVESTQTMPIIVNGVSFTVYGGIICKLPTPHYLVYRNWRDSFKKNDDLFAPPANAPVQAGYVSPPHRMAGTWSKAPIESK